MCLKKSLATCTNLRLESFQEHGFSHGHQPEHAHGLLLLLHLPQLPNTGLGEGDLPLAVHGQEHVHLQGGHSALLLGGLLSYADLGIISLSALGNECLAPWGKNAWLLLGRMTCCLGTNALLPRRGFSSLAPQRATQLGSQRTIQLGSLRRLSAWLPRSGILSLAS